MCGQQQRICLQAQLLHERRCIPALIHSVCMMQNMPRAELGKPGTTVYDTFMKPLVEECVQAGKLSGIVNTLITDERYK
jgi:hypothetical protein